MSMMVDSNWLIIAGTLRHGKLTLPRRQLLQWQGDGGSGETYWRIIKKNPRMIPIHTLHLRRNWSSLRKIVIWHWSSSSPSPAETPDRKIELRESEECLVNIEESRGIQRRWEEDERKRKRLSWKERNRRMKILQKRENGRLKKKLSVKFVMEWRPSENLSKP